MISFRSFSLVISIVLLRQIALQSAASVTASPVAADHHLHWLIGGCVLFCVIGKFLPVRAMFRADNASRRVAWQEMETNRLWLEWSWLVAQGWLLANTGAARLFAQAEQQSIPAAAMLWLWFLPTILFYSALEFGFTQLECLWSRSGDLSSAAHWKLWSQRVRLGSLGQVIMCIAPIFVLLTLLDGTRYLLPDWSEQWQAGVAVLCLLTLGMSLAPVWLQLWSGAKSWPNDDELVNRVRFLCDRLGVTTPRLMSLGYQQAWRGVALVGWTPLFRQVWVGSAVVQSLTAEQLDMVLLHELAHLKRGHCWWRIFPVLAAGAMCMWLMTAWPFDSELEWAQVLMALAFAIAMMGLLGLTSKRCELDADLQACRWAALHCSWADGQPIRAVNALAAALIALHDPQVSPTQSHWLHPSLAERMAVKP